MDRHLAWLRVLLQIALKIALVISGGALLARAAIGPFQLVVSVRNPIGAESTFAVCAVLLLVLHGERVVGKSGDLVSTSARATGLAADRLPHRRIIVDREDARLPFARREARACCGVQSLRNPQRKHAAHTRSFSTDRKNAARAHDRPLAACANLRTPQVAMVSLRAGYVFVVF